MVRPGAGVTLNDGRRGRIETVAGAIDPATRAFAARARLDDGGAALVGGRLVQVKVLAPAPEGAVVVPLAAVVQADGADTVFVKTGNGFVARAVQSRGSGDPAVIVSGLKPGERVAISNLPELRAAVPDVAPDVAPVVAKR